MTGQTGGSEHLVGLLAAARRTERPARFAGVHDAASAALACAAGSDGLWLSGLCLSTLLGQPDGESVTSDQLLVAATMVRDAADIPVLVDANAGFGGPGQVARLAARLHRGGIDGMSIEDKAFPRTNSLRRDAGFGLLEPAAFAEKVAAAKETGGAMLTVARTESLVVGEPLGKALERAHCYAAAGADALIVHTRSSEPVLRFAAEWSESVPLIVIPTAMPELSMKVLGQARISAVVFANQAFRAALWMMRAAYAELVDVERLADLSAPMLTMDDLFELQHLDEEELAGERYRRKALAAMLSSQAAVAAATGRT